VQQVAVLGWWPDLQDQQRDRDREDRITNATSRVVSRCTDDESASEPSAARAVPNRRDQRITVGLLCHTTTIYPQPNSINRVAIVNRCAFQPTSPDSRVRRVRHTAAMDAAALSQFRFETAD
jgi:hypothetical protein